MNPSPQLPPKAARTAARRSRTVRPALVPRTEPELPAISPPAKLPTPTLMEIPPDQVVAIHEAAKAMSPVTPAMFDAIRATTARVGGNLCPITVLADAQGHLEVLDGAHRLRACQELSLACTAIVYPKSQWLDLDPENLSAILNAARRQMPESQRAIWAARMVNRPRGRAPKTGGMPTISREQARQEFAISLDSLKIGIFLTKNGHDDIVRRIFEEDLSLRAARLEASAAQPRPNGGKRSSPGEPPASIGVEEESRPQGEDRGALDREPPEPMPLAAFSPPEASSDTPTPTEACGPVAESDADQAESDADQANTAQGSDLNLEDWFQPKPKPTPEECNARLEAIVDGLRPLLMQVWEVNQSFMYDAELGQPGGLNTLSDAMETAHQLQKELFDCHALVRSQIERRTGGPLEQSPGSSVVDQVALSVQATTKQLEQFIQYLPGTSTAQHRGVSRKDAKIYHEAGDRLAAVGEALKQTKAGKPKRRRA